MNSYKYCLQEALDFLNSLEINENINALWDVLHIIRWHKGVDYVMWIEHNKELIHVIIKYKSLIEFPDELKEKVWDTVYQIKKMNR